MVENPFTLSTIYGKCSKLERRELWQCLDSVAPVHEAWLIGGDFNIVRSLNERLGGNAEF